MWDSILILSLWTVHGVVTLGWAHCSGLWARPAASHAEDTPPRP